MIKQRQPPGENFSTTTAVIQPVQVVYSGGYVYYGVSACHAEEEQMNALPIQRPRMPHPRTLMRRAWAFNRPLTFVGVLMLITLAGTTVGILVDPLILTGQPAWIKLAKFAISISIYCFTLLWFLTYVRGYRLVVSLVAAATAVALTIEEIIIVGQVVRGNTSHFNIATRS